MFKRPVPLLRSLAHLSFVGLGVLLVLAVTPAAHAQSNYPITPTVVVTDAGGNVVTGADEVVPGQPLTVTADGWSPNTDVTLTLVCAGSAPFALGTFRADGTGTLRQTFDVPAGASGLCTLRLGGTGADGNPRVVEAPILVKARTAVLSANVARHPLARTGIDIWRLVAIAFALLAVGTAFFVAVRRNRDNRASTA